LEDNGKVNDDWKDEEADVGTDRGYPRAVADIIANGRMVRLMLREDYNE